MRERRGSKDKQNKKKRRQEQMEEKRRNLMWQLFPCVSNHPSTQSKEVVVMSEGVTLLFFLSPKLRTAQRKEHTLLLGQQSRDLAHCSGSAAPDRLPWAPEATTGDRGPGKGHGKLLHSKARLQESIPPVWKGTILLHSHHFVSNVSLCSSACALLQKRPYSISCFDNPGCKYCEAFPYYCFGAFNRKQCKSICLKPLSDLESHHS